MSESVHHTLLQERSGAPVSRWIAPESAQGLLEAAAIPPEWGVTAEFLRDALERSAAHRFQNQRPHQDQLSQYVASLHTKDLTLACACAQGTAAAWEYFVQEFRPQLYRAARAIAGDCAGRELADSLYAELYGLETRKGQRRSLFEYFHGRSRLSTWLRAILAQRHVDNLRRQQRFEPLPNGEDEGPELHSGRGAQTEKTGEADPERQRLLALMQAAVCEALAALDPRDRLRLACYYVDELTLAQIGRLLGEHEATASRKIERARRLVRRQVNAALRQKKRLSEAQVRLCYEYAQQEWPFDLTQALSAPDEE